MYINPATCRVRILGHVREGLRDREVSGSFDGHGQAPPPQARHGARWGQWHGPSFLALARRASSGAATKAAVAAAAGTAVLGLTSIASIVNGHDLGVFNVVAPLTN
jgi:hypothetical protein